MKNTQDPSLIGEAITGICNGNTQPFVLSEQAVLAMIAKGYTFSIHSSPHERDPVFSEVSVNCYPAGDGKDFAVDAAIRDSITNGVLKKPTEQWDAGSQSKSFFEAMDDLKFSLRKAQNMLEKKLTDAVMD